MCSFSIEANPSSLGLGDYCIRYLNGIDVRDVQYGVNKRLAPLVNPNDISTIAENMMEEVPGFTPGTYYITQRSGQRSAAGVDMAVFDDFVKSRTNGAEVLDISDPNMFSLPQLAWLAKNSKGHFAPSSGTPWFASMAGCPEINVMFSPQFMPSIKKFKPWMFQHKRLGHRLFYYYEHSKWYSTISELSFINGVDETDWLYRL